MTTERGPHDQASVYVVLGPFVRWETFVSMLRPGNGTGAIRVDVRPHDGSVGFVPVFSTHTEAQEAVDRLGRPAYIVELSSSGKVLPA